MQAMSMTQVQKDCSSQALSQALSQTPSQGLSLNDWQAIEQKVERLLSSALSDGSLRQQLLTDPRSHLQALGLDFPEGVEVCFSEGLSVAWQLVASADSQSVLYTMRLPVGGAEPADLSQMEELVAGGDRLTSLYSMCASLPPDGDLLPNSEKPFPPSAVLANLELLFQHSPGEIRMPLPHNWREQGNAVAKLIAQAWMDDTFKARFMESPVCELEQVGVSIPKGLTVEVVEELDAPWKIVASDGAQSATYSINIPAKPDDVSDDDLSKAVANTSNKSAPYCFCCL